MKEFYRNIDGELRLVRISEQKSKRKKQNPKRKYLSDKEIDEIKRLYPNKFNWELAEKFGVSETTILKLKRKHNLEKSDELLKKCRFEKGSIPYNKGMKRPMINDGQYKKGHVPANYRPIGSVRKTGKAKEVYWEIKVANSKWIPLNRYIYERNYGQIQSGYVVVFQDGNPFNFRLDNLKAISRAENLKRNQNRKKAAETLKKVWDRDKLRVKYGLQPQSKFIRP